MADQGLASRKHPWVRGVWFGLGLAAALGLLVLLLWPGTQWWVEHVDGVKLDGAGALTGKDSRRS